MPMFFKAIIGCIIVVLSVVLFIMSPSLSVFLKSIIEFIVFTVGEWGYVGIFIMMTLESSFFPFPSEVAMVPSGYLVAVGEMNFGIVLVVGTLGALFGSIINYFLAYFLGEKLIKSLITKYGKYLFIKVEHYEKAEKYFEKHGSITTFVGRFITVIRQLISLPAGAFKMNFAKFILYTALGAGLWNLILISIGYIAGENIELMGKYSKEATIGVLVFVIIIVLIYILIQKRKNGKS